MKLSVIMPVFNGERTLKLTLDSLLCQDFSEFVLICCDDGSTDSSIKILWEYSKKFKHFQILVNDKNIGLARTMNRLMSEVSTEYVAFTEQDDWYYPYRLSKQMELLELDKSIGLCSGIAEFYDGEVVTGLFPGILANGKNYPGKKDLFKLLFVNQSKIVNTAVMMRTDTHRDHGLYFDATYPNIHVDLAYFLDFSLVSKIRGLNEILVRMDRSQDRSSVTNNSTKKDIAMQHLIRAKAFQNANILEDKDVVLSHRTRILLKISQYNGIDMIIAFLRYFPKMYGDNRYYDLLRKRISQFYKSKFIDR